MTTPTWSLRRLHALDDAQIDELADVLIDCVEGGASVSFMHPLTRDRAVAFWRRVAQGVAAGERALLVAEDARGLCGTVQLVLDQPENQPHRADLSKMLVHRRARRQGLGAALMRAAEATARECGKTLLVLDTVTGGDAAAPVRAPGLGACGRDPRLCLAAAGRALQHDGVLPQPRRGRTLKASLAGKVARVRTSPRVPSPSGRPRFQRRWALSKLPLTIRSPAARGGCGPATGRARGRRAACRTRPRPGSPAARASSRAHRRSARRWAASRRR